MIEFLLDGNPISDITKRLAYEESFTADLTIKNNSEFLLTHLTPHSTKEIAKFSNVPASVPAGEDRTITITISGKEAWDKRQKDIYINWEYELEL